MLPLKEEMLMSSRVGSSSSTWVFLLAEFLIGMIISILINFLRILKSILPRPPRDLEGEKVLITGVTSSLGRCLALEFARCGCRIICVDDDVEMVRKTACELREKYHRNHAAYQCDLTERNAIRQTAQRIKDEVGAIDVLITSVGSPGQDVLDTVSKTLMSHYWTILAFLPTMIKQKRAHIVGVTPTSSTQDAYLGTRAAISGLMESLGEHFGSQGGQINFITVAPKSDPRLVKQSEEKIAVDIVEAVRRDQSFLSSNWWSTMLYHLSCAIYGIITKITRWFYLQECDT